MQEFTAAESAAIDRLANFAICMRSTTSRNDELSADQCTQIVKWLTEVPAVPTLSLGVKDPRVVAILAVFGEVLRHIGHEVTEGSRGGGLSPRRTLVVNRLADVFHNVPSFVALVSGLPFNERWFLKMMRSFDQGAGTRLEAVYQAVLGSQPTQSQTGLRPKRKSTQKP
jgi:hypothetical protein